jgi:hypothetical protein
MRENVNKQEAVHGSDEQTAEFGKTLNFETVRAALMETSAKIERFSEEADKKRVIKRNNRQFGCLSNRFGEMLELMVTPNLLTKLDEPGFAFTKANSTEIKDKKNGIFAQADSFLENGDKVAATEIKAKPSIEDSHGGV